MNKEPTSQQSGETKPASIRSIVLDHISSAIDGLVGELESRLPDPPRKSDRKALLYTVTTVVAVLAVASSVGIVAAFRAPPPHTEWWMKLSVYVAVTTVPHWCVEFFAWIAVALGEGLQKGDHKIGFRNPGAYLGAIERPLFLGSIVAGYPEFIAAWFVLKGIAGYKVGGPATRARRTFQLYLLNNAVSFAGVALAWLAWKLLALTTYPHLGG